MNPMCLCGCGKEVTAVKNFYIQGHNQKGQKFTKAHRRKISLSTTGKKKIKLKDKEKCTIKCQCGCGEVVSNSKNRFIASHNLSVDRYVRKKRVLLGIDLVEELQKSIKKQKEKR
jgi:hypothetical protein